MFDFDQQINRYNTNSAKFDSAVAQGYPADVLPMWVADMDFQTPECVRKALCEAAEYGVFGYSFLGDGYVKAVQNWFAQRFDWQVERDWLITTPGVVFALSAAIRAVTNPGDAVLVQPPVYYPFYMVVERNGRKLVENPMLYENGRYTLDYADFEKKIVENDVKAFILCSPHNPTCRVWTKEELRQIGAICKKHNVIVISDEIHCDFAFPEHPHTPFVKACPEMLDRTIICTAPSKSFNLAGLQVSNIFVPGQILREQMRTELQKVFYDSPNNLGAIACQAAYESGAPWLDACKAYMRENLNYVRTFLAERLPKIRLVEPEGTYFAWLDCTDLGKTREELDHVIIHKAKLWWDTGAIFGQSAALFQRVVLACPKATVVEAMNRLEKALNE